jgi:hypothetical protein
MGHLERAVWGIFAGPVPRLSTLSGPTIANAQRNAATIAPEPPLRQPHPASMSTNRAWCRTVTCHDH